MTRTHSCHLHLVVLLVAAWVTRLAFAVDLTPPGPPGSAAAHMPSLAEIEPRTLIDELPYTITNSGPHALTGDLNASKTGDGITIKADSVVLDLNGFTVHGTDKSRHGIMIEDGREYVVIRNGVLSGWSGCGIYGGSAHNSKLIDVFVNDNRSHGVVLGTNCTVQGCSAKGNSGDGIVLDATGLLLGCTANENVNLGLMAGKGSLVQRCVARSNGAQGFRLDEICGVSHCSAVDNGNARISDGFFVGKCSTVSDSLAHGNTGSGFYGERGVVFSKCVAYENRFGLYTTVNATFSHCSAYNNTWSGIYGDSGCSVFNCTAYANHDGIGAQRGSVVRSCASYSNRGTGYWIGHDVLIESCAARYNATNGIAAQAGSKVRNNMVAESGDAGIKMTDECHVEDNHIVSCGTGLQATGTRNRIAGNTLTGNTTDYTIAQGNLLNLLVSEVPLTITWPAVVTLAGPVTGSSGGDGFRVSSDDVTIDLGGHVLVGAQGSWHGIRVDSGMKGVRIRNGTIRKWGYAGIYAASASGMEISRINVDTNGYSHTTYGGIHAGTDAVITHCLASNNRDEGIATSSGGVIRECTSAKNVGDGFNVSHGSSVTDCTARDNGADGFKIGSGGAITDCAAYQNDGWGIYATSANRIESNVCLGNASGIRGYADNRITGNQCSAHTTYGIYVTSAGNSVDDNGIDGGTYGIAAQNASILTRNRVSGARTSHYLYNATTRIGPVVNMTAGGQIGTSSPWANFMH